MKSKLLSYFFKYSKGGIRSRTFAIIAGIPYSTTMGVDLAQKVEGTSDWGEGRKPAAGEKFFLKSRLL